MARLIKLSLIGRGVNNIFLDRCLSGNQNTDRMQFVDETCILIVVSCCCSDNLVDLGSVVPIVAKSKRLLVLLTKELIYAL